MYVQSFNTIEATIQLKQNCRSLRYKTISILYTDRQADRYTDICTDGWRDRQADFSISPLSGYNI